MSQVARRRSPSGAPREPGAYQWTAASNHAIDAGMAIKAATKKSTPGAKRTSKTTGKTTAAKRRTRPATEPPTPPVPSAPAVARRGVFIDVENTSSEDDLQRVLDHLKIDRKTQPTELYALGNWKSVGIRVARMLAGLGAQLIHSAPAPGVRDWSDLHIAVAAGRWLATAGPRDELDIISDDRAFDAVGDAAAASGVTFRRISYRTLIGAGTHPTAPAEARPRRRRRGGRGRGSRAAGQLRRAPEPAVTRPVPPPAPSEEAPPRPATAEEAAHAASHEQIRAALAKLSGGTTRWINLDALANLLRGEGFVRPPGSPRLITRVRRIKDVEVSPNGMVRLVTVPGEAAPIETGEPQHTSAARPRRRRTRARRRPAHALNAPAAPSVAEPL